MKMEMISSHNWMVSSTHHSIILTHIVVLWIPRPQKIANASNIDISQFVN